ncbi:aminoacyl tRNA synthase complex-interacting multifunctional protein 1 isoform X1 [Dendroctonus ponderosae]|uniref:aminoacyl tRNA synthase complex-interacting multifunctional protein 1 isoform X1 n=1 Tax=Dendroctonus ponderosae TaxID=77166 RepID=UPI002034B0D3|nr:aminoacyl tRNA synthase complex-interacting multifunctional protein 1 isoform X1 [Dendroctonus ponderosae]KAH1022809.1 hypothetical protein HUJ04_012146 [Dendroctonus ponderosae]KAH1022810.1 hypothetical protein HUJ04_012146 [Dendroctonus ponderosae]KAH1022811.1 hypothetical protein HUJ04_012146 [Dendroctonus ponderosae]KAH1029273.1 hypothetical protein HUJ05_002538 [Dendroctonus ponderosae]
MRPRVQPFKTTTKHAASSAPQSNLEILSKSKGRAKLQGRMSEGSSMDRIKRNAQEAKETIEALKTELGVINRDYNSILAKQLKEENARLQAAVDEARKKLIGLEIQNGVKQVPLPEQKQLEPRVSTPQPPEPAKPKKKKEPKEPKPSADLPVDIGRLDLRIGKVEDVQRHPDADALYVLKINCGEAQPRTVCSGLVKYIPIEELRDRSVLVLCNLKPVKMRGITSEAMVMCASSPLGVEVLIPPPGSQPGDLVECQGFARQPDAVMNPKKKIFETVAPDLHTNDQLEACYKGVPLNNPGKGNFVSKSLKNVPVK